MIPYPPPLPKKELKQKQDLKLINDFVQFLEDSYSIHIHDRIIQDYIKSK